MAIGSITELVATITGRIDGFRSAMQQGASATEGFANAWKKAGSDVATAASRVGTAIGAMTVGVVGYAARMGVAFNSMREDALVDFTVMLRSADKAKKMLAEMQAAADKSPMELGDYTQAGRTLLQYGIAGEEVMPILKRLGDTTGGNTERFRLMALAYGQVSATGRLMGQDLLQMINAGFNPLKQISERTGETMVALKKRMEEGRISIAEVNQAFIDATSEGGRFYGLMDEKSKTLTGTLATLRDRVKSAAGRMFEPLSAGLKEAVGQMISAIESADLQSWITSMRSEINTIGFELRALFASGGSDAIRSLGDAFIYGARGVSELLMWLRQSGPEIVRQTQNWLSFLQPIGRWIAANPGLVAGIVAAATAFKTLQILGVVSAFTSLVSAVGATITVLTQLPAILAAITAAATAATGALGTTIAAMMALLANPLTWPIIAALAALAYAYKKVADEARAAKERRDEFDENLKARESDQRSKVLSYQGANADETRTVLERHRDMAEKNRVGLEGQARGAKANSEDSATVAQIQRRAKEAGEFVRALDQKIDELKKAGSQAGKEMGQTAASEIKTGIEEGGRDFLAEANEAGDSKKFDKFMLKHRDDAREAKYDGYNNIRDGLDFKGLTKDQVQEFAGSQKGVSPQMAEEFAKLYEESDKSAEALDELALSLAKSIKAQTDYDKRVKEASRGFEEMEEKLSDLRGAIPKQEINKFAVEFDSLSQKFVDARLTAQQYKDEMKNLNNRIKDSQQAAHGTKDLQGDISQARRKLFDMKGDGSTGKGQELDMVNDKTRKAAFGKFDAYEAEGKKLAESFKAGQISAARYSQEMARLKRATDDVVDAALKEEQQKRREALLKGDFKGAGLDFNKAVQDKFADQQM